MGKIYVDYDEGVPQLACTICGSCDSVMGRSLAGIINRGCCHYFPDFSLAEIHRMLHLEGGKNALDIILANPGTTVSNFSILAKGTFHKEKYEEYLSDVEPLETGSINDHTIFFRTCPFVAEGQGCRFPVRFRTTVCNFFICSEILERPDLICKFETYLNERTIYSRWMHRESLELQHILSERGLNLITNFDGSIKLLSELQMNTYEFPKLMEVEI